LSLVRRRFESILLFGVVRPGWVDRLRAAGCAMVTAIEPGSGTPLPEAPDLCLSVGAFDTVDELPAMLAALHHLLAPGGLLMGAFAGGDSLPALRQAMQAADRATGDGAAAHVHPRIDAASFAGLLANAGFVDPVVDVDRVELRYATLDALVRDLRAMAATNRLIGRARRPLLRASRDAGRAAFAALGVDGRVSERIDILHFAGWKAVLQVSVQSRLMKN